MRLITTVLAGLLMLAPAARAQKPEPAPTERKPLLGARLAACTSGVDPSSRAATFVGSMPSIKHTKRMAMRFELQQRGDSGEFAPIVVPGWGWERSETGRVGFIYTKRVQDLLAPATYRASVRLRWYARNGRVLREQRRTTAECVQPDPRPDLVLGRLTASFLTDPGTLAYELVVGNPGGSAAAAFGVVLTVAGAAQPVTSAGPLAAGSRELLTIVGPRCEPGSTVTIALDPDGAVPESDEGNSYERPCPAG